MILRLFGKIKKAAVGLLAVSMAAILLLCNNKAYAAGSWVSMPDELTAEGAIVIDANSGAVLWGKNINEQYCPASITKLMTALVVLDKCSLDEEVTVTHEAVSNLESGASAVGLGEGDKLSVEELLYAMLLRSANDAANVLAYHVSGSIDAFAEEMNAKAKEIGCRNSVFRNPSGLTVPENLTTAYDMALIGAECSKTPGFLEIERELSYHVSGDSKYPDGFTVHQEHKMILKNTQYSDSRVIGGKTGFIKASGNTLVTIAEDNGLRLVAVVLRDKNPQHYTDTEQLLDFGFDNFENKIIEDPIADFDAVNRLTADKIIKEGMTEIAADSEAVLTLPIGADINDVTASYDYNLDDGAPEGALAKLSFKYADVNVGSIYLIDDRASSIEVETKQSAEDGNFVSISPKLIIGIGAVCIVIMGIGTAVVIISGRKKRERELREQRLLRRRMRLKELNVSEDEFMDMVRRKNEGGDAE